MTDNILSSFLSLFALFSKEEQVDTTQADDMLVVYMHHLGIRNVKVYLNFYHDMRDVYDMTDGLDIVDTTSDICSSLHGKIQTRDEALLLLRFMEFCEVEDVRSNSFFRTMKENFNIPDEQYNDFADFVDNRQSSHVLLHHLEGTDGDLKTLYDPVTGLLLFTYQGNDTVLLNDLPVLPGTFQVWLQSSVLKGKSGKAVYYSVIMNRHNEAMGMGSDMTQAVEFCGRDLNFRFPGSDNGIHNLSFTLRSGELLAVMGGSGAGKSTLMSLLNGSMSPQEGRITINGHDISDPYAKALIGFVPQDDLLIEELTVYQNLWYTAKLCFEGMPENEIDKRVMKTLSDLELDAVKNLTVGSPIKKYISGGQRKRLNIALELIREPAVLFLDEPTSGLSSADTEKVVNLLKELTYKGKLVVMNIHQPSSDVYKQFDHLWLLDKGGYPVFDGNPIDAITYFKEAAHYADANTSTCPTCGNVTPETMLNIIDEKALNNNGELSDMRKMTPQEWHEMYLEHRHAFASPEVVALPKSDLRKPNGLKQFAIFLQRNVKTKLANKQYLTITLLVAPLLALVCALLTRYAPPEGYTVMNNKNLVSYFFMAIIVATFIGMSGSAEEIIKDRALLKRERFLRLSYSSYIWSKIVYMAVVSLIQTLLFILVGNTIMGLHGLTGTWWLILFVTALLSSLTGLLLSQCLNSVVAIYITIPILLIPQILLCGLVVSFSDLTPKSTTGNVPLIGDLIPSRWAYEALAVTSFSDNAYEAPFFALDKERQETQFYNAGFLYELQSQLETMKDEEDNGKEVKASHLEVIRINLPVLIAHCGIEPYKGDYDYASLHTYLKEAEKTLSQRSNKATLQADALMSEMVRNHGKEAVLDLKKSQYNKSLEDFVTGAGNGRLLDIVDNHIVARTGAIYLTPQSRVGRAPFYSSEKILGSWHVKTLWFNLSVMLLMSVIVAILLFTNCPGRYLRTD